MKPSKLFFFFLFSVFLFSSVSALEIGSSDTTTGVIIEVPDVITNYSTVNVNNSQYWRGLATPVDILHSSLGNLLWSVAGHVMDTNLDMNDNNIQEVDKIYFDATSFISSDDNGHIDLHAHEIDLHGNLSTIWRVRLNADSDGPGGTPYGELVFGAGDTYLYYNGTDFIIDPDVVGSGCVVVDGNLTADYFFGSGAYLSDLNVSGNVSVGGDLDMSGYTLTTSFLHGLVGSMDMRGDPWYLSGTDLEVEDNITASWFNGQFNWTSVDNWNSFDGSNLDFNESKLSAKYYNATQSNMVAGTIDEGSLTDTQHSDGNYDEITLNFSEESGSPALDLRVNFTSVEDFSRGVMRYKTSSINGDYPVRQLWNYDAGVWDTLAFFAESEDFVIVTQPIFNNVNYIQDGIVQMRVYKASNGNTNNHYYVDWVAMVGGYGVPSGQEVDPFSFHKEENLNNSGYNITADYFIGDGSLLTGIGGSVDDGSINSSAWNRTSGNVFLASVNDKVGIGTSSPDASLEIINGTNKGGFMVSTIADAYGDLFIIDENGNVGIGTNNPKSTLHIYRGASGGTPNADHAFNVEDDGNTGFTILSPSSSLSVVRFGDEASNYVGGFSYDHNGDIFALRTAGSNLLFLEEDKISIGATGAKGIFSINHAEPLIRFRDSDCAGTPYTDIDYSGGNLVFDVDKADETDATYISFEIDGTEMIRINDSGSVGIGTISPSYPLEVNRNVSNISIYSQAQISATGYLTRTSVFDKEKGNALDYIKDANDYKNNGKINHSEFYGYAGEYEITDYSRPVYTKYIEEICEDYSWDGENPEGLEINELGNPIIPEPICVNVTKTSISYPYKKVVGSVKLDSEVDLLRQAVYELKQENDLIKSELCKKDMSYSWCK